MRKGESHGPERRYAHERCGDRLAASLAQIRVESRQREYRVQRGTEGKLEGRAVRDTAAGIVYLLSKHADVLRLVRCEIKEENAKLEWTMMSVGNASRDLWKRCDGSCREGRVSR